MINEFILIVYLYTGQSSGQVLNNMLLWLHEVGFEEHDYFLWLSCRLLPPPDIIYLQIALQSVDLYFLQVTGLLVLIVCKH